MKDKFESSPPCMQLNFGQKIGFKKVLLSFNNWWDNLWYPWCEN